MFEQYILIGFLGMIYMYCLASKGRMFRFIFCLFTVEASEETSLVKCPCVSEFPVKSTLSQRALSGWHLGH